MIKTELLAPAGSPESLDAAIGEGADAVYLGLKDFNARMRSTNFTYHQYEMALRSLHRMGKKLYVTLNTVFEHREADRVYQLLKYLAALEPDGIMVQDFGIVTMARENFPSLKLFASTQMNVSSAKGANFLSRQGFSRVVLSRELSLDEISEIRANTNMELEVFVHGALCVSVSGLCLFSSYLGGKSANRGMCTQACRRYYSTGDTLGGYYFSPSDLQLLEQIPALVDAGVDSFKIEGRMKSADYVGAVVSAYRLVLDNLEAGESRLREAMTEAQNILKNDFARSKTAYLINGADIKTGSTAPDWLNPEQSGGTGIPLGKIIRVKSKDENITALIPAGMIALSPGDSVRLHRSDDSGRVSHKLVSAEKDKGGSCWISIPAGYGPGDSIYLIQTKSMSKRYAPVIPRTREQGGGRSPGRDKAPLPQLWQDGKPGTKEIFPKGLYTMVSQVDDLYVLQSSRPEKVILPFSRKLINRLSREQNLPFPPKDIIISLDPFFPQGDDEETEKAISFLTERGYTKFIVNNLGHFSLLKNKIETGSSKKRSEKITLIAGPWLYTFNAWAWDFLNRCRAGYCITPLENNRQNLERTFPGRETTKFEQRSRVFITILARPSLFRIRNDLGKFFDFDSFSGSQNEIFRLSQPPGGDPKGSLVYPGEYFSIVDKIPFLREAGFSRFILDLSSAHVKKSEYRDLMEAVNRSAPLPNISRFNWKNGFFREKSG